MFTHYLFNEQNEIEVYLQPFESCDVLGVFPNNTNVVLTEEFVGEFCDFHKIEISASSGYVKINDVLKLPETKDFAPYVCPDLKPNFAYRAPDWTKLRDEEIYFDEITLSYNAVVRVCYQTTGNLVRFNKIKNDAICKATKTILSALGKDSSKEQIDKYVNYFNFIRFIDYHLPIRPLARIKCLLSIDKKYIDAIPDLGELEKDPNIDKTFTINLLDINTKINYVSELITSYTLEAEINLVSFTYSFTTPTFNTATDDYSIGEYSNFTPKIKDGIILKLKEKARDLKQTSNILLQALNDNGYKLSSNNDFIELAINDKCNKIYDMSFNKNGVCKPINKFRYKWLNSPILQDPTIVNFLKNLDKLYEIERCSLSLSNFCEMYVYPSVKLNFGDIPLNETPTFSTLEEVERVNSILKAFENKYNSYLINSERQYLDSLSNFKDAAARYKNFSKNFFIDTGPAEGKYSDVNETKKSLEGSSPTEIHHEAPDEPTVEDKLNTSNSLNKVYEVLQNLGGLCKLTNFGFSCVASILDTLDLNATTTLAVVKNFTLEEMKDKILPNIDQQQQREILNSLIEAKCITKEKMLFLLKNNLDIDQFNNLNLENKNYEDVKNILIDYMLE